MLKQIEGSHAVAEAVALCRPEVICAYPISPQTHIVEGIGEIRITSYNVCYTKLLRTIPRLMRTESSCHLLKRRQAPSVLSFCCLWFANGQS